MIADLGSALLATSIRVLAPAAVVVVASMTVLRHRPRLQALSWATLCVVMLVFPALRAIAPSIAVPLSRDGEAHPAQQASSPIGTENGAAPARLEEPWNHVWYERSDADRGRVLVRVWLTVAAAMAMIAVVTAVVLARWLRGGIRDSHASRLLGRLTPDRPIRLLVHERCTSPFSTGVFRPTIVLPASSRWWDDSTLEAVLAHEVAHIAHRDSLWNAVALATCAIYWFHPLAWLAWFRLRRQMEHASDLEAARVTRSVRQYARCLVEVAAAQDRGPVKPASFVAHGVPMASRSTLACRVDVLLREHRGSPPSHRAVAALAGVFVAATLGAAADVRFEPLRAPLSSSTIGATLLRELASSDADTRAAAVFKLARWREREDEVLPMLASRLGDSTPITTMPRWDFRNDNWCPAKTSLGAPAPGEVAALGLASMGRRAAPVLIALLDHSDPVVRRNSAWAIGELRHPRGLTRADLRRLIAGLDDPDPRVRESVAWSLGDIGDPAAKDALARLLSGERDPETRRQAETSLMAVSAGLSLEAHRYKP